MNLLTTETNKQEVILTSFHEKTQPKKQVKWKPVSIAEMYVFLALTMLMAHVKKHTVNDYWILPHDLTHTPHFSPYMSRDRYKNIMSMLHITTNTNVRSQDKLWKVRPIYDMLRRKFAQFFRPFQNLVIDESLVLFRGRLSFRQYIPAKRHRWGIKYFVLCDCKTGYVLDFLVYSGKGGIEEDPRMPAFVFLAV